MKTVLDVMREQAPNMHEDQFICKGCIHWGGGVSCRANVFISVEGCNMSMCKVFKNHPSGDSYEKLR